MNNRIPPLLVDKDELSAALTDFKLRNNLIQKLDATDAKDDNRFYKWVLSFWLGSNITVQRLNSSTEFLLMTPFRKATYIGYYCFLTLDKQISLLNKESKAYEELIKCHAKLTTIFNESYGLFISDLKKFFLLFTTVIDEINDENNLTQTEKLILKQTKDACAVEICRLFFKEDNLVETSPTDRVSLVSNDNMGDNFKSITNINILAAQFVTCFGTRYPFYNVTLLDSSKQDYQLQKILIKADDGTILDGLYVGKKTGPTKQIILALIGHFSAEDNYIANSIYQFNELFHCDIVFINHRNYSFRSNKFAFHSKDLALDIVAFANYFKDREIVLYGMCGGAGQILQATEILTQKNIPFKVIIDRFPSNYTDFIDFKTVKRQRQLLLKGKTDLKHLGSLEEVYRSDLHTALLIPLYLLALASVKSLLSFTHNNIDFAAIVNKIPESDLLILQIKEKKNSQLRDILVDTYVHPENDIRQATKTKRHANRKVLKELIIHCDKLTELFEATELKKIFIILSHTFNNALRLMENEKLTSSEINCHKIPQDLHSTKLFDLRTRNQLPLNTFLHGFFAATSKVTELDALNELINYSEDQLLKTLNEMNTAKDSNQFISQHLHQFLQLIKNNEKFIIYMSNRLQATGFCGLNPTLAELQQTQLFRTLSNQRMLQPISA